MKFKHVLLAIMFATVLFTSCKKDEEKPNKKELIESLNLSQTVWKGRYIDRSISMGIYRVIESDIAIFFSTEAKGRYQVDDDEWGFDYTHNKNIVNVANWGITLRGEWWIIDITEDTLYLQKNMDFNDNKLLCELKLTRSY